MPLSDDDERKLDFHFRDTETAEEQHQRICAALGVEVAPVRAFTAEILGDLDGPMRSSVVGPDGLPSVSETSFGIRWWTGYSGLGTQRRICIGDYLCEVAHAIEINLLEGRLHLSSLRAQLAKIPEGRAGRATDFLRSALAQIHVAGVLRAAVSVADCIGAAAVGVLGLPVDIKRADLSSLPKWKKAAAKLPLTNARRFMELGVDAVLETLEGGEPAGWLKWANTYRNTFVHRGRRHQYWHPGVGLRLPIDPDHSELEALLGGLYPGCLREPCEVTLEGIFKQIERAACEACFALVLAWRTRRDSPNLVEQPMVQWKTLPRVGSGPAFGGFAPREMPAAVAVVVSPMTERRYRAAAVDRRLVHHWKSFS